MNIKFNQKIYLQNINFKSSSAKPNKPYAQDIFIKSPELIEQTQLKANAKKIYDEVFFEVTRLNNLVNPIFKDIKINKPELNIDNNSEEELVYRQSDNTINVNLKYLKSKQYLIAQYDELGRIISTCGILPEYEVKKNLALNPDMQAVLLTEDEKELYLKSSFAHELRHCIQTHFILSCDKANEVIKKPIIERINEIKDLIEELKNLKGGNWEHECPSHYYLTYKPKKLLAKNSVIKKSLSQKNKECWSAIKFAKATINYPEGNKDDKFYEQYFSNPIEIDAYNFESEFFLYSAQNYKGKKIRNEIVLSIYSDLNYLANKYREFI